MEKSPNNPINSINSINSKKSPKSAQFNADLGMILDFFQKITIVEEASEIIQKSLEFFQLLFSPESIIYYQFQPEDSKDTEDFDVISNFYKYQNFQFSAENCPIPDEILDFSENFSNAYQWLNDGKDLFVKIETKTAKFGVMEIFQFTHPEYKDRYLPIILLYVNFCALAFQNLRHLKQIEEKEQRFRIVADYSVDWEFWYDITGKFLYNSPSCERLTGYSVSEIPNFLSFMEQIIFPEDHAKWEQHQTHVTETASADHIEFRIINKQGQVRWHHHVCQQIFDPQGALLGFRGSNRDITERKISEEHVKVLQGMLPICSNCKKIRSDEGYWEQIEDYLHVHSEIEFTHSICPKCAKELYGIDV